VEIKVSANKLAEFITAKTPERKKSIVRQLVRQESKERNYAPFYQRFKSPACKFMIGGCGDLSVLSNAIKALPQKCDTPWKSTDSRITKEAFISLGKIAPGIKRYGFEYSSVRSPSGNRLRFGNIYINSKPDLMVRHIRNGIPIFGAVRFYLAKESKYQIGEEGARYVAVMEYLWACHNYVGDVSPEPSLCFVVECMQKRLTFAPSDIESYKARISSECEKLEALWYLISSNEAA
jgi:hypothetical protein